MDPPPGIPVDLSCEIHVTGHVGSPANSVILRNRLPLLEAIGRFEATVVSEKDETGRYLVRDANLANKQVRKGKQK